MYVGTTKRSIKTRISEHKRNCKLGQIDKSAVAEHVIGNDNHIIKYEDTKVLATTTHYYSRLNREAIEYKHSNNFNKKEETLRLNRIWIPTLKHKIINAPQTTHANSQNAPSQGINSPATTRDASVASQTLTDTHQHSSKENNPDTEHSRARDEDSRMGHPTITECYTRRLRRLPHRMN